MEKKHPIQIADIQIKQLSLNVLDPIECRKNDLAAKVVLKHGSSQFDEIQRTIAVGFLCEINKEVENQSIRAPFEMVVEIIGIFTVGDEFPEDKILHWANRNAPYILLPYLRENVAALLSRAEINFHLPLVQVIS